MKLLITSIMLFTILSTTVFAQDYTFKDRIIIPPDVAFLWNFQRGAEELYRFVKFSSTMRIDYSLELIERRIGEMEVLVNKSKLEFIPTIENGYEIEIDKIILEMNSTDMTDIITKYVINLDIKENVTQRLQYDIKVLDLLSREVPEPNKSYLMSAIKKTSICIDVINRL
jgi:hypothetical protein